MCDRPPGLLVGQPILAAAAFQAAFLSRGSLSGNGMASIVRRDRLPLGLTAAYLLHCDVQCLTPLHSAERDRNRLSVVGADTGHSHIELIETGECRRQAV